MAINQDYTSTLMRNDGAIVFARKYYADRPEILETFVSLQIPVLKIRSFQVRVTGI